METLHTKTENDQPEKQLILQNKSISHLEIIAGWSRFFAILGFIFAGITILVGIFSSLIFSFAKETPGINTVVSIVFIILGLLYTIPAWLSLRFATNTEKAVITEDSGLLETALMNLKGYYKIMGLLTITTLVLCVLLGLWVGISTLVK